MTIHTVESIINGADSLAEFFSDEFDSEIDTLDILDALACLGLTIVTESAGETANAYQTLLMNQRKAGLR